MKRWLLLVFLSLPLAAQELTPADDARYRQLIHELRCLVCQNQNIADSDAPLAADLRAQVRTQMAAGRSDAEIKTYLTERYGDFVLYRPPFKAQTLLLWFGPVLLLLGALAAALLFWRRSRRQPETVTPDAAALKRLLDSSK